MSEIRVRNGKTEKKIIRKCVVRNGKRVCHPTGFYVFWVEVK